MSVIERLLRRDDGGGGQMTIGQYRDRADAASGSPPRRHGDRTGQLPEAVVAGCVRERARPGSIGQPPIPGCAAYRWPCAGTHRRVRRAVVQRRRGTRDQCRRRSVATTLRRGDRAAARARRRSDRPWLCCLDAGGTSVIDGRPGAVPAIRVQSGGRAGALLREHRGRDRDVVQRHPGRRLPSSCSTRSASEAERRWTDEHRRGTNPVRHRSYVRRVDARARHRDQLRRDGGGARARRLRRGVERRVDAGRPPRATSAASSRRSPAALTSTCSTR